MSTPLFRRLVDGTRSRFRDLFLLDLAAAGSHEIPEEARVLQRAAERRRRPARHLWRRGDATAALVLYREAAERFVTAKLVASGVTPAASARLSTLLDQLPPILEAEGRRTPFDLERVRRVFVDAESRDFDLSSELELEATAEGFDQATQSLARLVETRTPSRLRAVRAFRFALAALLVVGLSWVGLRTLSRPTNIAFERTVLGSPTAFGTQPSQAVNGVRFGELGFHSEFVESPWLTIDLGADFTVTRVKIYGRADCCFDQSVPLALEISRDNKSFREVAKRAEAFSAYDPWVVEPARATGRFVRLRTLKTAYLVLAEVEVFGRPRSR